MKSKIISCATLCWECVKGCLFLEAYSEELVLVSEESKNLDFREAQTWGILGMNSMYFCIMTWAGPLRVQE